MAFLRDGTGDVVTSPSQDPEDFPGCQLAWDAQVWRPTVRNPAEPWDELEGLWERLGDDARWDLGMAALNGDPTRQWHPGRYKFSDLTLSSAPGQPGGLVPVELDPHGSPIARCRGTRSAPTNTCTAPGNRVISKGCPTLEWSAKQGGFQRRRAWSRLGLTRPIPRTSVNLSVLTCPPRVPRGVATGRRRH
jgi:hypothetical protein